MRLQDDRDIEDGNRVPHTPTPCLAAVVAASPSRSSPPPPSSPSRPSVASRDRHAKQTSPLANCFISHTTRLITHLPGLPQRRAADQGFRLAATQPHIEDRNPNLTQSLPHQSAKIIDNFFVIGW